MFVMQTLVQQTCITYPNRTKDIAQWTTDIKNSLIIN